MSKIQIIGSRSRGGATVGCVVDNFTEALRVTTASSSQLNAGNVWRFTKRYNGVSNDQEIYIVPDFSNILDNKAVLVEISFSVGQQAEWDVFKGASLIDSLGTDTALESNSRPSKFQGGSGITLYTNATVDPTEINSATPTAQGYIFGGGGFFSIGSSSDLASFLFDQEEGQPLEPRILRIKNTGGGGATISFEAVATIIDKPSDA